MLSTQIGSVRAPISHSFKSREAISIWTLFFSLYTLHFKRVRESSLNSSSLVAVMAGEL